jgi:D-alanine-D-alanine ligase
LKDRKIGVLMGGMSEERDISLKGGDAVYRALVKANYNAVTIDVARDAASRIVEEKIELAFIALHGRYGEDGCIQGLLELMGIPYTGSSVLASAIAMNKVVTKKILLYHGIPTPIFNMFRSEDPLTLRALKMPLIVKPISQGSTIGVEIVRGRGELTSAVNEAFRYGDAIMVENFIEGREFTVSILNGKVLPIIEIRPREGIYDFKAKYIDNDTEYTVPAKLPEQLEKKLKRLAIDSYEAIGCRGHGRVDMVIDDESRPNVLEINTLPGMAEGSLLPKAAASAGIGFSSLVEEILLSAVSS